MTVIKYKDIYKAQKGTLRKKSNKADNDSFVYPHEAVDHSEINNVINEVESTISPFNKNKIQLENDSDSHVDSFLRNYTINRFKDKLGIDAEDYINRYYNRQNAPYYYLVASDLQKDPLSFWIHRGKNPIKQKANIEKVKAEYWGDNISPTIESIYYYSDALGLPRSYTKQEVNDLSDDYNYDKTYKLLKEFEETLKSLYKKEVETIRNTYSPEQKAELAKTRAQMLIEKNPLINEKFWSEYPNSRKITKELIEENDKYAEDKAWENDKNIDEFIKKNFGKKIADKVYDPNTYESLKNYYKNLYRKNIGIYNSLNKKSNMKYIDLFKMQEGGTDPNAMGGNQNPACMAISQALPQLPDDLKTAAEQAIQSGQCEQFIQMLQQQAQTGSVNSESPMAQEGMPMARFGARFGKPLSEIEYGKKIGRIGLYEIAKAQKGLFGRKQKTPMRKGVDVTKMSYDELYNHFRSIGYADENAKRAAQNLDEGNQLYHRPKNMEKPVVEKPYEKEQEQKSSSLLSDLTSYVTNEILSGNNEKNNYQEDNIKGRFTDSKGEVWDIEEEDPENPGKNKRTMVRKYLAPDMLNEEFPDPTEWNKKDMKNREEYNKNMRKEYYEKEGLMDNSDPLRGEISEYIVKYKLPITEAELDNMSEAEKMVMLDKLRKKDKASEKSNNQKMERTGYIRKVDPKQEKNTGTDNIIQKEIIEELIRQGFKGDKDMLRVMSDLVWEKMKRGNFTILQAINEFSNK